MHKIGRALWALENRGTVELLLQDADSIKRLMKDLQHYLSMIEVACDAVLHKCWRENRRATRSFIKDIRRAHMSSIGMIVGHQST